jgi:NAD(P)-dependent dehydrogenase (short-subunit alcohol dehydrogenase family)
MSGMELAGRVAVITGGSAGLGLAMAEALGEKGAALALVARDRARLDAADAALRARGFEVHAFSADVSDEAQVGRMAADVLARFGKVQILINNAGMNIRRPMVEFSLAEWRQVLDTNLTSAFLVSRAFVPHMKGQGWGRIINLASMMSHVALPGRTAYCASKAALLGFTRALALELAPDKITVNGISPGPFNTEINRVLTESEEQTRWFMARIPMNRWGAPREVGKLAAYLCSDEAGFITGADMVIDGGWTAQ